MPQLFQLELHSPLGVFIALVPALLNAVLIGYALRTLPRSRHTTVFLFFTTMLMTWQLYHCFIRASATAPTAELWRGLLGFGFLFAMPAGAHLALLFANADRLVRKPAVLIALYAPPTLFEGGFRAGFNSDVIVANPYLGWIASGDHSVMGQLLAVWIVALSFFIAAVLWSSVYTYRHDHERRGQALLLAGGVSVPIVTGLLLEVGFPHVLGLAPFPITSTMVTAYSLAAFIALTQLELFNISTDDAAAAVLETVNDLVVISDERGRLVQANSAAIRIFSLVPSDLRLYTVHDLFPKDRTEQDFERSVWRPTVAGRMVDGFATRVLPRNGKPIPVLLTTARIRLGGHGPPGVLLVAHDVSALVRTEEALWAAKNAAEQANAAKSRFLANMTQALMPPLDKVVDRSSKLAQWAERNQYVHLLPELREVQASGSEVKALVDDILDLTRIESGRLQLFSDEIDVRALVDEVSVTARQLCADKSNVFRFECGPEVEVIRADRNKLLQVLFHLISNAAKFCEEGDVTLEVRLSAVGIVPGITFTVRDTGIGMDADQMSHLFKAFAEVTPERRRRYGGSGVGLMLARQYCRLMGGEITASSLPEQGSEFRVWIPVEAVPEAKRSSREDP